MLKVVAASHVRDCATPETALPLVDSVLCLAAQLFPATTISASSVMMPTQLQALSMVPRYTGARFGCHMSPQIMHSCHGSDQLVAGCAGVSAKNVRSYTTAQAVPGPALCAAPQSTRLCSAYTEHSLSIGLLPTPC